ncbi:cobalamin biosynthesis protein CobD [Lachnospiraceae bacterium]|nr:cobalamin biosynthesis protein CobD [Lachnospiraceae bacterium]
MLTYSLLALFLGICLDFFVGDPKGWYHPVMAIGWLISRLELLLRCLFFKSKTGERLAGVVLTALVVGISAFLPAGALFWCYHIHPAAGILLEALMCGTLLAAKSLQAESMKVAEALEMEGLSAAREAVSMIVGRDTRQLDEAGVIRAAVETVAENTSDGVVAPLLFMAFFGGAGGFFYKSVNTLDSMVGYKNDTYQYFGTAAAKLDDFVNFIPARISAMMMIAACGLCRMDQKNAWRIYWRDRKKHASPNSAQTEAAAAGALQIQLAGDAWYFGKKYEKPWIGDNIRPPQREDIARSCRLMFATSYLTAAILLAVKGALIYLIGRTLSR